MKKKRSRILVWSGLIIALLAFIYFALPFGIPKPPAPNCGPEQWAWLDVRFDNKQDFIDYLQEHEQQYLTGSHIPRLADTPPDTNFGYFGVPVDWQSIKQDITVENRLFYKIYKLTYHHPACMHRYTLKVTSFGWASLFGCCGV